jgi:fused signal recognition particle receptor
LKRKLVGKRVRRGEIQQAIRGAVASALRETMELRGPNLMEAAAERNAAGEPLKLLFVGPNGAGKTTTMAKIAEMFMRAGKSVIFSASDSYRAAAIEQTEEHASRLGIKAIKHKYGSDPAAVCFDAVNYAKAHGINVVLMDTAGRQETNRNLIDELKKIARVAKPDLKIFVGESIAGNALVEQVRSFKEAIGLDGVILTKLDCDAKGGTALSVARASGVPVLFFGVGQRYEDLLPFDPDIVLRQVLE